MEIKKPVKKEVKTQPRANLPVVSLNEKEMSAVSGGHLSFEPVDY